MTRFYVPTLGLLLAVVPFYLYPTKSLDLSQSKDIYFLFMTCFLFSVFKFKENLPNYFLLIAVLVFMSFKTLTDFFSINCTYRLIMLYSGVVFFLQFYSQIELKDLINLKKILALICIMQVACVLLQCLGVDVYIPLYDLFGYKLGHFSPADNGQWKMIPNVNIVTGSLANPTYSAALIVITCPFLFSKRLFALLIPTAYALYRLGSAACMICFAVALSVWITEKYIKRKKILYSIIVGILISLAVISSKIPRGEKFLANNDRFIVWENAVVLTSSHKLLTGFGLGFFADYYWKLYQHAERWTKAHNEFLEVFVAYGLIGVFILGYFVFMSLKDPLDPQVFSALITTYLISNTHFLFHISTTAIIGLIIIAMSLKLKKDKEIEHGIFIK